MKLTGMYFELKMDREIIPDSHYIMPGGYCINGKEFDFNTSECNVSAEDPTVLKCDVYDYQDLSEDEPCFITKKDVKEGFDEFFEYCGEKDEPEIHPVEVISLQFNFRSEKGSVCLVKASEELLKNATKALAS